MFVPDPSRLIDLPQWSALSRHAQHHAPRTLAQRFADEPSRFDDLSFSLGDLLLDFSRQRLGPDTLALLIDLARARRLESGIAALAAGQAVNHTEQRAAGHMALRAPREAGLTIEGKEVVGQVAATLDKMDAFVSALQAGRLQGASGQPISHVVNLGIGGSDLGPRMVAAALAATRESRLKLSFVASPDPAALSQALSLASPQETLFIVSSKSFSTAETLDNAKAALAWLTSGLPDSPPAAVLTRHFAAVTHNLAAAQAFGVAPAHCFDLPEWVGGRFSVWSAIGLPVAAGFGMADFRQLLAGARSIDSHFVSADFEHNLPVLMALVGLWNVDFLELASLAVLPYCHGLRHLPAYLQQLEMESNGKSVNAAGEPVGVRTAPILWGCAGPLGQHAFHQQFFQGTPSVAIDFVVPVDAHQPSLMLTQALAQAAALAFGKSPRDARAALVRQGHTPQSADMLAAHLACPGNVPSTTLLLPGLTPFTLGQLLALYEHKVFVQGWLWGVNSFDQFGVEYGKCMARAIAGGQPMDAATAGLWRHAEKLMERQRNTL